MGLPDTIRRSVGIDTLLGKSMGGCKQSMIFNDDRLAEGNRIYTYGIEAEIFVGLDATCSPFNDVPHNSDRWLKASPLWKDYVIFRQEIDNDGTDDSAGRMDIQGAHFYTDDSDKDGSVDRSREVDVNRESWSVSKMAKIEGINTGYPIYHKQMENHPNLMRTVLNIVYRYVDLPYEDDTDLFEVRSMPGDSDPAYADNELVNAQMEVFNRHFNDIEANRIKLRYYFYNENNSKEHAAVWYLDTDGVEPGVDKAVITVKKLDEVIEVDGKKANKYVEIRFHPGLTLKANSGKTPAISIEFAAWFGSYASFVGDDEDDWSYQDVSTFTTTESIEIVANNIEESNLYGDDLKVQTDLSKVVPWPSWPVWPYLFDKDPSTWPLVASPVTGTVYKVCFDLFVRLDLLMCVRGRVVLS